MLGKALAVDTGIIFEEEFRRQIRRAGWRIFTFGVPVVLLLAMIIVPILSDTFSGRVDVGASEELIGYVDNSGITDSLPALPGIARFADLNSGTKSLAEGEVESLFVIPENYLTEGSIDWYRKGSGLAAEDSSGVVFRDVLRAAVADESLAPDLVLRIVSPAHYVLFSVDDDGRPESTGSVTDEIARAALPFVFAMLLLVSIFVGSASLLQSVAEEKENRMVEMLITSTTPMAIMLGKVFGLGAAGLLQIAVWLAAAAIAVPRISDQFEAMSSLALKPDLLFLLLAFYLAGYFVFAALMASIGAAANSVREASQISAIITIPAVLPIWLSSVIITDPDGTLARVLTFFPLTSPTASMMRIAGGTNAAYETWIGLLITALSGVVLLWLSARVFRAGLLMYGQRMGLRSVLKAMRQAD